MVLAFVLGAGFVVGGLVAIAAARWPAIEAPRLATDTIVHAIAPPIEQPRPVGSRHRSARPRLVRHLRRHYDPATETGVALIIATAVIGAATVGIGILIAMVRSNSGLYEVDLRLARLGADHATATSTYLMKLISELGGTRGVIAIAVVAGAIAYWRRSSRAILLFLVLVVAGQFALSNLIKLIIERARPDLSRLTGFSGASFPSGHAAAAAATLAAIALVATQGRSRRAKAAGAAVAAGVTAAVAATRVFLGVHWTTDVIAGMLLGWAWFAMCSIAFGGRILSFGQPVAVAEAVAEMAPGVSSADPSRSSSHSV